jgi:thymidine phosphorylase
MVALHKGDTAVVTDPTRFQAATHRVPLPAPADGTVTDVDPDAIGRACLMLGAGRTRVTDKVDHSVGISGIAKVGQAVSRGDPMAFIHANSTESLDATKGMVAKAFVIKNTEVKPPKLIMGTL